MTVLSWGLSTLIPNTVHISASTLTKALRPPALYMQSTQLEILSGPFLLDRLATFEVRWSFTKGVDRIESN